MSFIRMEELLGELRNWGITCHLAFDYFGDGWVIEASNRYGENLTIHHGFEYQGEIFANTDQLTIESHDDSGIKGRLWVVTQARFAWFIENRSVPRLNDFVNDSAPLASASATPAVVVIESKEIVDTPIGFEKTPALV